MRDRPWFEILPANTLPTRMSALDAAGFAVFALPSGIRDRQAFFDGVRTALPLDPPVQSDWNLDALEDSLWVGLGSSEVDRLAIVWPDVAEMVLQDEREFNMLLDTVVAVADILAHPMRGDATKLILIVLGL